jgi:hypothetical protein
VHILCDDEQQACSQTQAYPPLTCRPKDIQCRMEGDCSKGRLQTVAAPQRARNDTTRNRQLAKRGMGLATTALAEHQAPATIATAHLLPRKGRRAWTTQGKEVAALWTPKLAGFAFRATSFASCKASVQLALLSFSCLATMACQFTFDKSSIQQATWWLSVYAINQCGVYRAGLSLKPTTAAVSMAAYTAHRPATRAR